MPVENIGVSNSEEVAKLAEENFLHLQHADNGARAGTTEFKPHLFIKPLSLSGIRLQFAGNSWYSESNVYFRTDRTEIAESISGATNAILTYAEDEDEEGWLTDLEGWRKYEITKSIIDGLSLEYNEHWKETEPSINISGHDKKIFEMFFFEGWDDADTDGDRDLSIKFTNVAIIGFEENWGPSAYSRSMYEQCLSDFGFTSLISEGGAVALPFSVTPAAVADPVYLRFTASQLDVGETETITISGTGFIIEYINAYDEDLAGVTISGSSEVGWEITLNRQDGDLSGSEFWIQNDYSIEITGHEGDDIILSLDSSNISDLAIKLGSASGSWVLPAFNSSPNNKSTLKGMITAWSLDQTACLAMSPPYTNPSGWNVSAVTDMSGLFDEAPNFNEDISNWAVSQVTDVTNMFNGATNFNCGTGSIGDWFSSGNIHENLTSFEGLFKNASNFDNDISNWDTSKIDNMKNMFNGAVSFNQDITRWRILKDTDLEDMFKDLTLIQDLYKVDNFQIFSGDTPTWKEFNRKQSPPSPNSNAFNAALFDEPPLYYWDFTDAIAATTTSGGTILTDMCGGSKAINISSNDITCNSSGFLVTPYGGEIQLKHVYMGPYMTFEFVFESHTGGGAGEGGFWNYELMKFTESNIEGASHVWAILNLEGKIGTRHIWNGHHNDLPDTNVPNWETPSLTEPVHIVITSDAIGGSNRAGLLKLYINGVYSAHQIYGAASARGAYYDIIIGDGQDSWTPAPEGILKYVKVYDWVKPHSEIYQNYRTEMGIGPNIYVSGADPAYYWDFRDVPQAEPYQWDSSPTSAVVDELDPVLWLDASELANGVSGFTDNASGEWDITTNGALGSYPIVENKIMKYTIPDGANTSSGWKAGENQYHSWDRITDIRTIFWVVYRDPGASGGDGFLLGDDTHHDFHTSDSSTGRLFKNDAWTREWIRNGGIVRVNGHSHTYGTDDGYGPVFPSELSIISLQTRVNVEANNFSKDRELRGFGGGLGELIIFNKPLSEGNILLIEGYLANKWRSVLNNDNLFMNPYVSIEAKDCDASGAIATLVKTRTIVGNWGLNSDGIHLNNKGWLNKGGVHIELEGLKDDISIAGAMTFEIVAKWDCLPNESGNPHEFAEIFSRYSRTGRRENEKLSGGGGFHIHNYKTGAIADKIEFRNENQTSGLGWRHGVVGSNYTLTGYGLTSYEFEQYIFTLSGTEMKIYINGVDKSHQTPGEYGEMNTFAELLPWATSTTKIGKGYHNFWDGIVKYIKIYKGAMSAADVSSQFSDDIFNDSEVNAINSGINEADRATLMNVNCNNPGAEWIDEPKRIWRAGTSLYSAMKNLIKNADPANRHKLRKNAWKLLRDATRDNPCDNIPEFIIMASDDMDLEDDGFDTIIGIVGDASGNAEVDLDDNIFNGNGFYVAPTTTGGWAILKYKGNIDEVQTIITFTLGDEDKYTLTTSGGDPDPNLNGVVGGTLSYTSLHTWVGFVKQGDKIEIAGKIIVVGSFHEENSGNNICFPGTSLIETDQGEIMIKNITTKNTIQGLPVKKILKTINKDGSLIKIKQNAFGHNIPNKDTYISRNHGIYVKPKQFTRARNLVDNDMIVEVKSDEKYIYNILLSKYAWMYVNDICCETLNPINF